MRDKDIPIPIVREDNIRRFWISFTTWFVDELPGMGILQAYYEEYNNWNERYDFTVMVNKRLSRFFYSIQITEWSIGTAGI